MIVAKTSLWTMSEARQMTKKIGHQWQDVWERTCAQHKHVDKAQSCMLGGLLAPNLKVAYMLSRSKTEYMKYKFDDASYEADVEVRVNARVITTTGSFKYLGSIIKEIERSTMMLHTILEQGGIRLAMKIHKARWGVASIVDKIRKVRLRWFGHVKRSTNALIRRCERLVVIGLRKGRSRLRKNWREVMRHDVTHFQLTKDMTLKIGKHEG
ncbi:hypothetical protein H5410_022268 [Solanum commersonii]|uniref:Uncharacterized protein n=1 Tax=Solanum commersonii TaxID=4109 RepID=A0A9J5ZDH2_SOLCO|nr:hypothetical protein H5410_022268 [Solanum commersonii]